jgi:hypothetical protein
VVAERILEGTAAHWGVLQRKGKHALVSAVCRAVSFRHCTDVNKETLLQTSLLHC